MAFDMSNIPPEAFRSLFHKIRIQNRNQKVAQQHASGKKQGKQNQASGSGALSLIHIYTSTVFSELMSPANRSGPHTFSI